MTCPWCNAPRAAGPTCPRCEANYAKAEQIKVQGRAAPAIQQVVVQETIVGMDEQVVEDPALEFKLCVAAIPVTMVLGVLFHYLTPGIQRIVFGMPLHELGHAITAWFCGYFAIPTLWRTMIPEERSFLAPIILAAGLGYMIYRAYKADKTYLVVLGAALLVLQGIGTLFIREGTAEALFTFGGDGLGMVLATALMCTFFFGKRTQLYKGWLRWGFVVIGAAAFADMSATWIEAYRDPLSIPYGEIEGVGLSDAARLVQQHFWSEGALVRRYMAVAVGCMAVLALVYVWGVRLAWKFRDGAGTAPRPRYSGQGPSTT